MGDFTYNARPHLERWFTGYHEGPHYAAVAAAIDHLKQNMLAAKQPHLSEETHGIKVRVALDHVMQSIIVEPSASGAPEFLFRLPLQDLDFSFSEPVYSTVPRLLLKVPQGDPANPVNIVPADKPVPITVSQAGKPEGSVITFANEEGEQPDVHDRPIVQISHLTPGEYVIVGKVPLAGREDVWTTIASVMGTPEGENPFADFDAHGTVEQLGQILTGLRTLGYSNQYNTDDTYRRGLASLADTPGARVNHDKLSGFYEKPSQNVKASLLHLIGDFAMLTEGRANEVVRGDGYALAEIHRDGTRDRRPISADYARTFNSRVSDKPLDPANERISFATFRPDHALADFGFAFNAFTTEMGEINADYARGEKPAPGPRAAYG